MKHEFLLDSFNTKKLLKLTDCTLMHERERGSLKFVKKANAYFYLFTDLDLLLKLPLCQQFINWYVNKYDLTELNYPSEEESKISIIKLIIEVLLPLKKKFGDIDITYGSVGVSLNKLIQKNSPKGTCPAIDQNSSNELNSKNNTICKRGGATCDFSIIGFEDQMNEVVSYIVRNLDYDKIYYYGNDKPIHVSISDEPSRHLQIMNVSKHGRVIPGKKGFGEQAVLLSKELK